MDERSPLRPARAAAAAGLLLVGLALFGVWRLLDGSEAAPYAAGATPPVGVQVTAGHDYQLAVPGGVAAMRARGVPVTRAGNDSVGTLSLQCRYTQAGVPGTPALSVVGESVETKAVDVVGTFVGPVTGRIAVTCAGWGAMFVPDSDDRPFDRAGLVLVAAIVALTLGAGLGLGALYAAGARRRPAHTG